MKPVEAVKLTRLVHAICPAQVFDEFTADVWGDLLADTRVEDAITAVKALGQRQRFIAPSEIRDEVRRIRADRLERVQLPCPPYNLAADPVGTIEWLNDWRRRVGDGETPDEIEGTRRMPAIEGVFPGIPKADYSQAATKAREYLAGQARTRAIAS